MPTMYFTIRRMLRRLRNAGHPSKPARAVRFILAGLVGVGSLHAFAIAAIEGWSLGDAFWFTATAGTTVGFGDLAPASALGRLTTVALIYVPAIPAIGYLTSLLVENIIDRRDRTRLGRVRLMVQDHILFINYPAQGAEHYFCKAIDQFRQSTTPYADRALAILSDAVPTGLPQPLVDRDVRLVSGRPNDGHCLEKARADEADTIIILAPSGHDTWEESLVFDIADQVIRLRRGRTQSQGTVRPRIIAEAWTPEMKTRLLTMGVDAVVRPIRAYPELIVRATIAPGSETIVEALFDAQGEECQRLEQPFVQVTWRDLVHDLMVKDLGTPLAIEDDNGTVRADLRGSDVVSGRAVYLIVPTAAQTAFEALQAQSLEPMVTSGPNEPVRLLDRDQG